MRAILGEYLALLLSSWEKADDLEVDLSLRWRKQGQKTRMENLF